MEGREIHNHFEKDSHCQVFQGPVSGCVFAMPGSVVHMAGGESEPPSERAMAMLTEFISSLNAQGKEGKELLAPYASAYKHGYAKKMGVEAFNREYGTSIGATTYNNWMSPVFNDTDYGKYNFTPADLRHYDTKFEELQK